MVNLLYNYGYSDFFAIISYRPCWRVSKTFTALLSFIFAVFCSGLIPGGITTTIIQVKHVIKWYHSPYSYDYTRYYVLKCIIWAIISFIFFVVGIGLTIGACYIIWNNYFNV